MNEVTSLQKIMLDTMQYDKLLYACETRDRLFRLLSETKIELLSTHIQKDEILAIDNAEKRTRLDVIFVHARLIATRGVILDKSKVGFAGLGDEEDYVLVEHIRGEAWERKGNDALIAATAAKDADLFVTDDKPLTRRLNAYPALKCEVIDFAEFSRRLFDWMR